MQLTKKHRSKKKPNRNEEGHFVGKYWCNCRTRNYRQWLGVKMYGHAERLSEMDHIRDDTKMVSDSLNSMET